MIDRVTTPRQILADPSIVNLLDVLSPAWVTGGTLRDDLFLEKDLLAQKDIHSIDIATGLDFDTLLQNLEEVPCLLRSSNRRHLSLCIVLHNKTYVDITCLRIDTSTDGRHATTLHTTDIALDSARRDFTINALYMSSDGQILDFHDGITDLKNRRLRFVGNPDKRISEDILRLLRFFRFLSPFQDEDTPIASDLLSILSYHVPRIALLSKMRQTSELLGILRCRNPERALKMMDYLGIMKNFYFPLDNGVPLLTHKNWHERLIVLLQSSSHPRKALANLELLKEDRRFILSRLQNDDRGVHSKW